MKETFLKQDLLKRGWTNSIIKKLNPSVKIVPQHGGGQYNFYKIDEIQKLEELEQFKTLTVLAKKRSERAMLRVNQQISKVEAHANSISFKIREFATPEILLNAAISAYNNHHNFEKIAFKDSSPEFLDRITVNFLRHAVKNYDASVEQKFGKVGVQTFHDIFYARINSKIGEMYPHLSGWIKKDAKFNEEYCA